MSDRPSLKQRALKCAGVSEKYISDIRHLYPSSLASRLKIDCMVGPRQLKVDGQPRLLSHIMVELFFEHPMHPSWRLSRKCNNGDCVNPLHLEISQQYRFGATEMLAVPTRAPWIGADSSDVEGEEAAPVWENPADHVAILKEFRDHSDAEAADLLGLSKATVRAARSLFV